MHHIALCCLEGSTSKDGFFFYHGLNGLNEVVLWRKEEIKKFVAFPGLTPLQPDAYGQPCKRASLSDPPHLSGLPCWQTGKPSKQNSCPWQYKMSLLRGYGRLPQTFNNGICSLPYRILPSDICGFILILCP